MFFSLTAGRKMGQVLQVLESMKSQTPSTKSQTNLKFQYQMTKTGLVRRRRIGHCYLPFDLAQGGESFDFAQDREPVERLVEPFVI